MIKASRKGIVGNGIETIKDLDNSFINKNYRGSVVFKADPTDDQKKMLEDICPTKALFSIKENNVMGLDNGKCIMCGYCSEAASKTIEITSKPAIPTKAKNQLIDYSSQQISTEKPYEQIGNELKEKIQKMFGRSLAIRQVDAGSCNGCEIEITALNNPIYDIERFGIHFVASPRHADMLMVTGPVSRNMKEALIKTYEATPTPKIVVAVGDDAIDGGIFKGSYGVLDGVHKVIPVNFQIPGDPPSPKTILCHLLQILEILSSQPKNKDLQ